MSVRVLYDMKKRKIRYRTWLVDEVSDLLRIDDVEGGFVLLLVDLKWQDHAEDAVSVAKELLHKQLRSVCTWADGHAQGLHDLFDKAIVDGNFEDDGSCIITTWHDKDPVTKAVWYMIHCASPVEPFDVTCKNWIAAVVADEVLANSVVACMRENLRLFPKGWKPNLLSSSR